MLAGYLSSKLGFAQTLVKPNLIIPLNQSNTKRRWDKIFCRPFHPFKNIVAVNNRLDMLRNSRIRS